MSKDGAILEIFIDDVVLADYMLLNQTFEILDRDGSDSRKSDIDVKLEKIIDLSDSDTKANTDSFRKYMSTITVSIMPEEKSSFYQCQVLISGLFVIEREDIEDKAIRKHIAARGTQELYDIVRVHLMQMTSNGVYGTLVLPSVKTSCEE